MPVAFEGRRILVTGASSGLGAAFARALARRGARLVLVARRADRLRALAAALGPAATALPLDLAAPDALDHLPAPGEIDVLVSSAGAHHYGDFTAMPEAEIERLLALDATVPVRLVRRYLPAMDARGAGGVLLVASTGGLMPAPRQAVYAASKALIVNFAQSLYYERGANHPVPVTLCCPGGMPTPMLTASPVMAHIERRRWMRWMLTEPDRVAAEALAAFEAGRPLCIPGRLNRAMDRVTRLLPRALAGRGAAAVYRP
ncbi:MAG: SDR family NAD(P)-dependent oxidoreductase [Myxococcales bacterium]|nr:SDR family NAD(P)-dependent oxidoreductase [Myxococcales bacterium]